MARTDHPVVCSLPLHSVSRLFGRGGNYRGVGLSSRPGVEV